MRKKALGSHASRSRPGLDDIAGSLAKASELGGTTVMEEMEVGDGVSIGLFTDPEGHLVGLAKS